MMTPQKSVITTKREPIDFMYRAMEGYARGWTKKVTELEQAQIRFKRASCGPVLLFNDGVACRLVLGDNSNLTFGKFSRPDYTGILMVDRDGRATNIWSAGSDLPAPPLPKLSDLVERFRGGGILGLILGTQETH